ncbi:nSTAND1 domain-containing NTPase [Glycomyces tarimensis]
MPPFEAPDEHQPRGDVRAALESVLDAAVDTDGEGLRELTSGALSRLRADFAEPGDLVLHVHRAIDALQDDLYRQETRRRIETDGGRRRAVQLRLVREQLVGLTAGIDATGPAEERPDPRWQHEPPYRGLWPFSEDESAVFYGRSRLTAELTGHLEACLTETGMAVVTGASGAGKSSLIRAGLIPAIANGQLPVPGSQDWPVLTTTPGAKPLENLARRLAELSGTDAGSIRNTLASRPDQAYLYARQAVFTHTDGMEPDRRDRVRASGRLLLFIDQFEELFTLTRDDTARHAFITALFAIASGGGDPSGVVVIGVRGDFIDRCAAIPAMIPILRRHSFVVGPPEPDELRQVITGPAAAAGLRIDDGLTDDLLADLRSAAGGGAYTAGALPLLSQTMLSLWQRRDGARLTRAAYNEIGGVGRAIEAGAERVYQDLDPRQRALAAEAFRRLTVIDRHGEVSRRRAARSALLAELPGAAPVLETFTAARLVVMVGDSVEIAHDVLLRSWKRLDTWLQEDRMHRALLTEVADDAAEWLEHGKEPSFLYQGAKLEAAERTRPVWKSNPDTHREWNAGVEAFLDASARVAARRAGTRRLVTVALIALLAVSLTAAGIAFQQNRVAEAANTELTAERNRLLADDLAEASADNAGRDGDLSRLLAAAAWQIDPDAAYENTMARALDDPVDYTAEPHVDEVEQIAFAPGGETLVSSSGEGDLVVWDVTGRTETAGVDGLDADDLAFSPDGAELAVSTADGVHLLDPADLSERDVVQIPADATGFGYGPEGLLVAVDSTLIAIDPASEAQSPAPPWSVGDIDSVAFSTDLGAYLIGTADGVWTTAGLDTDPERIWTGSGDRRFSDGGRYMLEWSTTAVSLIDLELGRPIRTMGMTDRIGDAAVDADGSVIALAVGSEVRYVRTDDMTQVTAFDTAYPDALDFSFSADGTTIAITGAAGTKVWKLDGDGLAGAPLFDEPEAPGRLVRLHPDGESLMIVDAGSHRRFDLATGEPIDVHWDTEDWIAHVSYSPDGRWITVVDGENHSDGDTVRLDLDDHAAILDADSGEERLVIEPVNGETAMFGHATIAYSPDGATVAAVNDNAIRIWDLADGAMTDEITGDFSATSGLQYSPDGSRLLALGDDTPMVWDLDTGELRTLDEPTAPGVSFFGLGGGASFTNSGRHIAQTSESDRTTEVWDADTGAHLVSLAMTGEPLAQLHVPAREAVFALASDGTLFRQDLGFLTTPYETLCARTDRSLTEREWAEHLRGLDYGSIEVCD